MTEFSPPRPGLLVSVRSADEAESAIRGGADLIDVKEPSRGSLGRADDKTISEVVQTVAGRVPVSAAMGELTDKPAKFPSSGLSFAKWGLAGWRDRTPEFEQIRHRAFPPSATPYRPVFVAYADWQRADSPPVEMLCRLVCEWRMPAFVIDTYIKDGSTLLDWMTVSQLTSLTGIGQGAGVRIALAGSLGKAEIAALRSVGASWFAIRGAACSGGRIGAIDAERVRELKQAISLCDSAT